MTVTCDLSVQTKRRCYIKETAQVTRCEVNTSSCLFVRFKIRHLPLHPRISDAIDKLIESKASSMIPCHTDLLFDCSLLAVGDVVIGTTPSRKGVVGKITRLDFIDNGSWHEMKAIEVEWMDGEIGNPYPNQMAKYVGRDRT
jgi:hypothetical protein